MDLGALVYDLLLDLCEISENHVDLLRIYGWVQARFGLKDEKANRKFVMVSRLFHTKMSTTSVPSAVSIWFWFVQTTLLYFFSFAGRKASTNTSQGLRPEMCGPTDLK